MTQPSLFPTKPTTTEPMPDWLLRRLDAAGVIDASSGASRRARPASCPRCHRTVIRALDADVMALTADADPEPLSTEGEALARLAGIRTYELRFDGDRPELDRRDPWRIRERPAGVTRGIDVLAAHQCQPVALPRAPSQLAQPAQPTDLPDQPPF